MAKHEFTAANLLCASDCEPFTLQELLSLADDDSLKRSLHDLPVCGYGYHACRGSSKQFLTVRLRQSARQPVRTSVKSFVRACSINTLKPSIAMIHASDIPTVQSVLNMQVEAFVTSLYRLSRPARVAARDCQAVSAYHPG